MYQHQRGIGLLEVLIAVVVMSIGFLASARMQVESMRAAQEANAVSQARFMLLDMSERMRSNRGGLDAGYYDDQTTQSGTQLPPCALDGSECSPLEIATADLHQWSSYLHPNNDDAGTHLPLLPSDSTVTARGTIAKAEETDARVLTVYWRETVAGQSTERQMSVSVFP